MKTQLSKIKLICACIATCITPNAIAYNIESDVAASAAAGASSSIAIIEAAIAASNITIGQAIAMHGGSIDAALQTSAAQAKLNAQQIANAYETAKKAELIAESAVRKERELQKKLADYGPNTGQGYNPCKILYNTKNLAKAPELVFTEARIAQGVPDNANGKLPTFNAVQSNREAQHQKFCTEAEVVKGLCQTVSPLAGADTDASILFQSSKKEDDISNAKNLVRQNILGTPNYAVNGRSTDNTTTKAYLLETTRKDALSSIPAYSLAHIQAMNTVNENLKDEKGVAYSARDFLFKNVTQYYGGKDAEEWTASMIKQRPRGLLVEMAKINGLGAWMDLQELESYLRMKGNIAALTVTAALPLEERLSKQRSSMVKVSAFRGAGSNVNNSTAGR